MKSMKPGWMLEFHAKHGVWPIAGGSSNEGPPGEGQDGNTITVPEGQQPPPQAPSGETPPAHPSPTYQVDPQAFNRGTQDAPGAPSETPRADAAEGTTNPQTGRVFTEAEVEAIRKEEKDKLYGRIDEVTNELKTMREEREAEQRAKAEEEARREEEARTAEEGDLDVKELLQRKEQEWNNRFQQLEEQRENDRALLEKERQFNALQEYQRNILEQHADDIMPELRDTVGGNSEEEIQASAQRAIEKTNTIMQNIQAAQQAQHQAVPTARVTQPGGSGPLENSEQGTRTYSKTDLQNMSMAEYAAQRDALLNAASRQGPYGR